MKSTCCHETGVGVRVQCGESKTEFDVCEMFSRPRLCTVAEDLGPRAWYCLNIETKDIHTNKLSNFLEKKDQVKLMTLLAWRPTQLLLVSPPCKLFLPPQRIAKVGNDARRFGTRRSPSARCSSSMKIPGEVGENDPSLNIR